MARVEHSNPYSNVKLPSDVYREMKIAAAHRDESVQIIIRSSWEAFKTREGKKLHARQEKSVVA